MDTLGSSNVMHYTGHALDFTLLLLKYLLNLQLENKMQLSVLLVVVLQEHFKQDLLD